jgi:hypothetical protein
MDTPLLNRLPLQLCRFEPVPFLGSDQTGAIALLRMVWFSCDAIASVDSIQFTFLGK